MRLEPDEVEIIDRLRGERSRSGFLRMLLHDADRHEVVQVSTPVAATPAPTLAQVAPAPPRVIRTQPSKIIEVVEVEHIPGPNPDICKVCGWRLTKRRYCPGKDG